MKQPVFKLLPLYPKAYSQWQERKNSVLVLEKLKLNGKNKTSLSFSEWSLLIYLWPCAAVHWSIIPPPPRCHLHNTKWVNAKRRETACHGVPTLISYIHERRSRAYVALLLRHVITIFNGLVIDSSSKLYSKGSQSLSNIVNVQQSILS